MYKILPARHIKRLKAIQDYMAKETNPVNQSPVGPTAKLMNTAKNVIFSTDAAIAENKQEHDLVMGKIDQLREELDDIVASECILCGETMIKSVDQPFIDDDELDVITSWAIQIFFSAPSWMNVNKYIPLIKYSLSLSVIIAFPR